MNLMIEQNMGSDDDCGDYYVSSMISTSNYLLLLVPNFWVASF